MTSTHPTAGRSTAEPHAEEPTAREDEGAARNDDTAGGDGPRSGEHPGERLDEQGALRATIRVRRRNPSACPLAGRGGTRTVDAHGLSCVDDCEGAYECRATVETDRGHRMVGRVVDEGCVCPVFQEYDCVSSVDAVEHGDIIVSLTIPDREELPAIVESLRDRGATVDLRSIARADEGTDRRQLAVKADSITEKQREAIRAAFEEGYYETPRRADLGDLAERLGVSRSAVSQRLTGAESTLVEALYEHERRVERR